MYSKELNVEYDCKTSILMYHRNLMLDILGKSYKINRARILMLLSAKHLTTLTGDVIKIYDLVKLVPERQGIVYRRAHILIESGWLNIDYRRRLGGCKGGKKATIYVSLSDKGEKLVNEFWSLYDQEVKRYEVKYNYVVDKVLRDKDKGAYINID